MAEKELQAHDMVRRRSWSRAVTLYDQLLASTGSTSSGGESNASGNSNAGNSNATGSSVSTGTGVTLNRVQKERLIACLLGRCECLLELGKYEPCLVDARRVLGLLSDQSQECLASISRTRRWLVHALCKLKKYTEADQMLREWIAELNSQQSFADITKTLERYKSIILMVNNGNNKSSKTTNTRLEDEMATLDTKLDHWATNNLPLDKYSKLLSNKGLKKREGGNGNGNGNGSSSSSTGTAPSPGNAQQQQLNGSLSSNSSTSGGSAGSLVTITSLSTASSASSSSSSSSSSASSTAGSTLQKTTDLLAAINLTGGKHQQQEEGTDGAAEADADTELDDESNSDDGTTCSYCAITFKTRNELRDHCQTESHQNVIMSDEGRDWKWRPPPRGFTLDYYGLCESYSEAQTCHYGNQCVEAHGLEELNEWKERFEYRRMRLQKACEKELYGKSYTEQILERWIQATAPDRIMCEKVDGVEAHCEQELVTSISSKSSKREWVFLLTSSETLKAVALLQDAHRNHFAIKSIKVSQKSNDASPSGSSKSVKALQTIELKSNQEWVASPAIQATMGALDMSTSSQTTPKSISPSEKEEESNKKPAENSTTTVSDSTSTLGLQHQVIIEFHTDIYGTFRQAVCFDFGTEPMLVRHLCVDVVPVGDIEKIEEIKRDIINSSATRWDVSNTQLAKFETTIGTHLRTEAYISDLKHEKEMLERYPCPRAQTFTLTQSTILEKRLTQNNYRSRIHELLYVEEIARYEQIARFNVRTRLTVTTTYILTPAGMATSTAKYSLSKELFALMRLGKDISEDTSPGRLILSNCSSVYISPPEDPASPSKDKKRKVYEALIEDKGKNVIYLKLSAKCVEEMALEADTEIEVDIQFQLNRLPYCEWHNAVDKITDFKIIFPDTDIEPNIPWTPKKQWSDTCEPKLNAKQREAVNAITTSLGIKLPPILLIGPFGTGKTYTLAQAIKQLLIQPDAKILICTHSNSAADLYIKEYLHPWIEEGLAEATPLRVYYHKRWVATVNQVVQKYCITDELGNFRRPTVEDIMKHRIVVVTLSISMELATLGLPKGYFTHIFLDEAAQAMECEAIMPLALANDSTRIVLAGDHMQMSPELFSAFAKERKLHISLLERLYDHYPSNFPCKILLCENYRAHEAIIKFTSELFYEQKLIASGKQPRHERFYPLTFFTTRGEDVQDKNSTAFYNNAEVYEVVERVCELRKKWPSSWGKVNDASIGIMTPYADQVFRIRSELRKRRMGGISVERVLNVQGKQFRAVFLSTVRTRRTCMPQQMSIGGIGGPGVSPAASEDADYGFLSNSKLLNTAITRAQSLVAVVGDPVALCSIGRCRKVWERFIEICDENKSLFGITWSFLRSQLDGVELKRGYVLNPLAPVFVPRALQPEAYVRDQAAMFLMGGPAAAAAAAAAVNTGHHGGHGPAVPPGTPGHHGSGSLPPHLNVPGMPHMPPHHAAITAAAAGNQQIPPHMYAPHSAAAAYSAAAAAAAIMNQSMGGGKGPGPGHHFPGNNPQMAAMRPMGPPHQQQQPQPPPPTALGQQFNPRGPPPPPAGVHPGANPGGHFPQQYMAWQQAQQQQQQLRGNGPPTQQGPNGPLPPQSQNPNASLWGPPPQSNPWSVLPKQQIPPSQQPPGTVSGNNSRPLPPQQQQQQQQQQANPGMRGGSVPIQPPPSQQQPPPMRANPSDLGFLAKKSLFGQQQHPTQSNAQVPPPPLGNFSVGYSGGGNVPPPNQLQPLLNQNRNVVIPNGPISPMDPFLQQRPPQAQSSVPSSGGPPPPNNFYGANNIPGGSGAGGPGVFKDKDFQFLNNVHIPLNVFQGPPPSLMNSNSKQQSPTALRFPAQQQQQPPDCSALLPPNMNIYEMAFESKESQYKWYLKLMEMQGQEAATKFMEVLRQVMTVLQQQQQQLTSHNQSNKQPSLPLALQQQLQLSQSHLGLSRDMLQQNVMQPPPQMLGGNNSLNSLNPHHQQQQQQSQQQHRNSAGGLHNPYMNSLSSGSGGPMVLPPSGPSMQPDTPPLDGGINFNQQVDLAFNSLMNGNEIAQPILRDLFGVVGNGVGSGMGLNIGNSSGVANDTSFLSMNGGDLLMPLTPAALRAQQESKAFSLMGTGSNVSGVGSNANSGSGLAAGLQKSMFNINQQHATSPANALQAQQQQQQQHMQQHLLQGHSSSQSGQQQQQSTANFLSNPTLLNSKELMLGTGGGGVGSGNSALPGNLMGISSSTANSSGSSVPLYRRQAAPLNGNFGGGGGGGFGSNMHNANGGMTGLGSHQTNQLHHSNTQYNSQQGSTMPIASTSSVSISAGATNDNVITNDILTGLGTSGGNLIEALFHNTSTHQQQQQQQQHHEQQQQLIGSSNNNNAGNNTFQKMLYNNFGMPELFARADGGAHQMQHQQQQQQQQQQQLLNTSDSVGSSNAAATTTSSHNHHSHQVGGINTLATGNTQVTYAAVLSQGPLGHKPTSNSGASTSAAAAAQNASTAATSTGASAVHGQHHQHHQSGGAGDNSGSLVNAADKDPFAAIRELGQATNGFYNYFQ